MEIMNNWNQFLTAQGARPVAIDGAPDSTAPITAVPIHDFGQSLTVPQLQEGFVAAITDQGLIGLSGDDAASFLHGQLTNDVEHLNQEQVRLAGYCTPKGRLLASFLMWRNATTIYLQLPRAIQPAIQKRLQMFVLRAKAKLHDASLDAANQVVLGLGGKQASATLSAWFPALPATPFSKVEHASGTLLRVADAFGSARYEWLTSAATARDAWPELAQTLAKGGIDAWRLSEIHAGIPQITAATQEQFVPQMVNFELLGGVNFKKGCYPGQEIVARSQYLGKLKRRTTLVSIADPSVVAGGELFAASDPEQPCGMVVNAAPNGDGGIDALVEMKLGAIEEGASAAGAVRYGSALGAHVQFLSMPYVLDALDL
ncbi:CAF17-like 4Fe-4S cluster assembly/insertion protein YgfZ [Janthinobacterium lividum]|uniref:Folate-binding protein n=1 Tax=Janthinobacterium lividum TaxID=29581 RepID=A0ABU0XP27_9BURK|nr:folate-binding protein [Janthinobacterium lividum]MDQ4624760.1 folate-binding protein [Janthinobacterium lividum]MDQ4673637.1 folate-binding protein [Janthinobacterium lividum]MDQ4684367.1 folate-binding protein [Janthinobacterium lividum]